MDDDAGDGTTTGDCEGAQSTFDVLVSAARRGRLCLVIGSGVSVSAAYDTSRNYFPPSLSWGGLLRSGMQRAVDLELRDRAWAKEQEAALCRGAFLPVAQAVRDALGTQDDDPFGPWMREAFTGLQFHNEPLRSVLHRLSEHASIVTTNYDSLCEMACPHLPTIHASDVSAIRLFLLGSKRGIYHVHGHYTRPSECVLGEADYASIRAHESVQASLRALMGGNTMLFLGCGAGGLSDPNIGQLLTHMTQLGLGRPIVLIRSSEVDSFGDLSHVQLESYGANYSDLLPYLERLATTIGHDGDSATSSPSVSALLQQSVYLRRREGFGEGVRGKVSALHVPTGEWGRLASLWHDVKFFELFFRYDEGHALQPQSRDQFVVKRAPNDPYSVHLFLDTPFGLRSVSAGVSITYINAADVQRLAATGFMDGFAFRLQHVDRDEPVLADDWLLGRCAARLSFAFSNQEGATQQMRFSRSEVHWPDAVCCRCWREFDTLAEVWAHEKTCNLPVREPDPSRGGVACRVGNVLRTYYFEFSTMQTPLHGDLVFSFTPLRCARLVTPDDRVLCMRTGDPIGRLSLVPRHSLSCGAAAKWSVAEVVPHADDAFAASLMLVDPSGTGPRRPLSVSQRHDAIHGEGSRHVIAAPASVRHAARWCVHPPEDPDTLVPIAAWLNQAEEKPLLCLRLVCQDEAPGLLHVPPQDGGAEAQDAADEEQTMMWITARERAWPNRRCRACDALFNVRAAMVAHEALCSHPQRAQVCLGPPDVTVTEINLWTCETVAEAVTFRLELHA